MHPRADKVPLARHAQPPVMAAGGHQQRATGVFVAAGRVDNVIVVATGHFRHVLGLEQFHPKALGLGAQTVGKDDPLHPIGKAGHIVQLFRGRGLPAIGRPLDDESIHRFPPGVERRCQPGRAAANDNQRIKGVARAGHQPQFACQFCVARLHQHTAIPKENRGDNAFAAVLCDDKLLGLLVLFDVYPIVGN